MVPGEPRPRNANHQPPGAFAPPAPGAAALHGSMHGTRVRPNHSLRQLRARSLVRNSLGATHRAHRASETAARRRAASVLLTLGILRDGAVVGCGQVIARFLNIAL